MLRALSLLTLLVFQPAGATTFMERSFPDAVKDAPVVVRGRVGTSYANWVTGPDGTRRIFTFIELTVDEVLKGPSAAGKRSLTMRELGGEKDGVGMQVAGTAHFNQGEDTVVFLNEPAPDGAFEVRGMMMAKYTFEKDEDGVEVLTGAGMGRQGHGDGESHVIGGAHNGTPDSQKWTLDTLKALIVSQGQGLVPAPQASNSPPNQSVKAPTPAPLASAAPAASPAPQLQNSPPESASSSGWLVGLGAIAALLLIGVVWLRRLK